jgi:hypothetical protein
VVVAPPPPDAPEPDPEPYDDASETGMARVTLRLPESLKARVEAAADRSGVSTNTWLVRALTTAVSGGGRGQGRGPAGHTLQGWVR